MFTFQSYIIYRCIIYYIHIYVYKILYLYIDICYIYIYISQPLAPRLPCVCIPSESITITDQINKSLLGGGGGGMPRDNIILMCPIMNRYLGGGGDQDLPWHAYIHFTFSQKKMKHLSDIVFILIFICITFIYLTKGGIQKFMYIKHICTGP